MQYSVCRISNSFRNGAPSVVFLDKLNRILSRSMQPPFRHQCLIYQGAPSRQLPALAATMRQMLSANYRCLYLNSPANVAGMSSYLAAAGIDVADELSKAHLVFSSDQSRLPGGGFDVDEMIGKIDDATVQALTDGYKGLWATGDMSWEFGSERNLAKLLKYERQLEELFRRQPMLCGICQYHSDLLPHETLRQGLLAHRAVFINETLSRVNPHYTETDSILDGTMNIELDKMINNLRGHRRTN
ncbi:MAG: MEDS domain-containing protein [Candidatus Sulfotelmatobacter sp.]